MNKPKIYIDGKEGTTGLQIYERLGGRDDLELLLIDEDKRKDTEERRKFLNAADLVFLCLPDAAAVEAVSLIENGNTKVIDASTAHRTAPGWAYGFAELSKLHRAQICESMRVSNPGCHATGFISIVYPLVGMGIQEERIFVEDQSHNTRENLQFAQEIAQEQGIGEEIAVVTQGFHMYRATQLAKAAGFTPYSLVAETEPLLFPEYYGRELLSLTKWQVEHLLLD